jgi:hypothetical protein
MYSPTDSGLDVCAVTDVGFDSPITTPSVMPFLPSGFELVSWGESQKNYLAVLNKFEYSSILDKICMCKKIRK